MPNSNASGRRPAPGALRAEDVDESFVRSAGSGGQNVNKVSTCVELLHRPTGVRVRCQDQRSQAANRALAWKRLADKLAAARRGEEEARRQAREKARRASRRPSAQAKRRMLEEKAHRARVKRDRRFERGRDD